MIARALRCTLAALAIFSATGASAGSQEREVSLDIAGKTALGDLVVPDGKTLADGVLVLTHGTLAHKDMELVENLQALLAERGIPTLAHSLILGVDRRTGMYDCNQPHTHAHEDAVVEISAWTDWLRSNGAGTISHLGHSRAGNQVVRFAKTQSEPTRLVLLAPATGQTADEMATGYESRFKAKLQPMLDTARSLIAAGKGNEMMDVPGFIYCGAGKASPHSVVSYYTADPAGDTASVLSGLPHTALVIAGSADTVVPQVPAKFGAIADGERVRLEVIEDADHMFLDFYAEDAADLIAEFLNQ